MWNYLWKIQRDALWLCNSQGEGQCQLSALVLLVFKPMDVSGLLPDFWHPWYFQGEHNNALNSSVSRRQLQKNNVKLVQSAVLQLCQQQSVLGDVSASALPWVTPEPPV